MAMMKEGGSKAEDTRSIISGFTEGSSKGEERMRQQGISFNRLPMSARSQDVQEQEQEQDESTVRRF